MKGSLMVGGTRRDSESDEETALALSAAALPEDIEIDIEIEEGEEEEQEDEAEITHLRAPPEPREKRPLADEETHPRPAAGDTSGALETVPLNHALVQHVLAQVDARAAARRAAQQPQPAVNAMPAPHGYVAKPIPPSPVEPPRRLGVEIAIAVLAFLAVAVPALYFLYGQMN